MCKTHVEIRRKFGRYGPRGAIMEELYSHTRVFFTRVFQFYVCFARVSSSKCKTHVEIRWKFFRYPLRVVAYEELSPYPHVSFYTRLLSPRVFYMCFSVPRVF